MPNIVKILSLGGLDENGKNMIVVELNNDIFVFEAGLKYPESSMPGIDKIIPDASYLIKNKNRVRAYFISHGQDDQMGALAYLIKEVPAPIYTSPITAYFIKDTVRRFHLDKVNFDFKLVASGETHTIAGYQATFFATTHSTMQSLGISLATSDGQIVYTGDFIFDFGAPANFRTDIRTISQIGEKPVLVLLSESMGATKIGHTSPNHRLTPLIEPYFQDAPGRIILTAYAQSLFHINEIVSLALKYKRKILFYSREMNTIIKDLSDMKVLSVPTASRMDYADLTRPGHEDAVILVTGVGEKVFHVLAQIATGDNQKNLKVLSTDTFIVSTPPIVGLEKASAKAVDELYKTGATVHQVSRKKLMSMHPHHEDLKQMLSMLRPKYYMPVKGEYHHLMANAQVAVSMGMGYNHMNTFVFDNGMTLRLEDGKRVDGKDEAFIPQSIFVDGLVVGDVGAYVIQDRQKLSDNGVAIFGITIDRKKREIVAGPDIQMRGLIYLKNADDFVKSATTTFVNTVEEIMKLPNYTVEEMTQRVRERLIFQIRRATGKDPIIIPAIVEI